MFLFIPQVCTWTNKLYLDDWSCTVMWRRGRGEQAWRREQGHANGSPQGALFQSQGNPEPHSINPVALSLSWPGSKKRRTWMRTASGRGSFRPSRLCNGPSWFQEQKVKTEKMELRRRPRIGVNGSQGLPLANFLKDTSAQEWSPNQTLIYNLTMQEFPASSEPHLFYPKFSPPHLCQETAEKASQSGEERQQKRKFRRSVPSLPWASLQYPPAHCRTRATAAARSTSTGMKGPQRREDLTSFSVFLSLVGFPRWR